MEARALLNLQPSTLFHGRYAVVRSLKAGSMGAVYEVVDRVTSSRRALKVMLPEAIEDADLRARFAQEAQITGGIESDYIVRIMDAGVDPATGGPFLVMELLQGEELGALVKRRGALLPAEVVTYLSQVARALEKTHAAGVVHRDLKPENLFLTYREDGTPCVKVLDFGVAKALGQRSAGTGTAVIGTPLYMAPEQIRGDADLGPGADLYALGHIAYTLLVGEPYWKEELKRVGTVIALLSRILDGAPEAASARAARRGVTLPAAFDEWFQRATAPRPAERFARAISAAAQLAEALGVAAPRPSVVSLDAWRGSAPDLGGAPATAQRISGGDVGSGAVGAWIGRTGVGAPVQPTRSERRVMLIAAAAGATALTLLIGAGVASQCSGSPEGEPSAGEVATGSAAAGVAAAAPSGSASAASAEPEAAAVADAGASGDDAGAVVPGGVRGEERLEFEAEEPAAAAAPVPARAAPSAGPFVPAPRSAPAPSRQAPPRRRPSIF